jgi:signal transduction histidine kinase
VIEGTAVRSSRLFWWLHGAGWAGVFLISYLSGRALDQPASYWKISLPLAVAGFLVTLGLRRVLRRLADQPPRRLVALMVGPVLLACGAMALVYILALSGWCAEYRPHSTLGYVSYVATTIYIVMTWVALYIGIKYQARLREQTEAALAASATAHEAQLRMLRYQLNPHFLFNTLNAISTLILDRDGPTANRMVQGLSAFLRHSLDHDPVQQVTLAEELAAIDLYLGIEAVRFAERLRVEKDIAPDCEAALVPGLLLQPLVENAIKHGVAKTVAGGTVRLSARRDGDRLLLGVADDGPGIAEGAAPEAGVGLANARDRLRVLYGAAQRFEIGNRPEGGCEVRVRLPFERAEGACAASAR